MTPRERNRFRLILGTAIATALALGAIALIVFSNRTVRHSSGVLNPVKSEISTIDPRLLIPHLADLPLGSSVQSNTYITTAQASRLNQTSLTVLRHTGREIGFERDFLVPRLGEIDVEIVRFKSHAGMGKAYSYFLRLPGARGMDARPITGIGEQAALVTNSQAGFVEFMRGRYYAVITTVPATRTALQYIHGLAQRLDVRIRQYGPTA